MSEQPARVDLATPDLAAEKRSALEGLFPGVLADGVLDATRLGDLLDTGVTAPADGRERFGLTWAGKQDAVRSLLTRSRGALVPEVDRSIDFDRAKNVFIEGDNLEVLKLLQKAYNDKVKLIYIDPPYNTGNDFVYEDDFSDGLRNYLEYTGQVDIQGNRVAANAEVSGRRHSRWLTMMYPRLVLARNMLTQDGVLFISIDDNEVSRLHMLLEEVFGRDNFIAQITIRANPRGRSLDSGLAKSHEYLLAYARDLSRADLMVEKSEEEIQRDYPLVEADGRRYRWLELRNTHREYNRGNRANLWFPMYAERETGRLQLEFDAGLEEIWPVWPDGFEGCWTWGPDKVSSNLDQLRARSTGRWIAERKSYVTSKKLKTIWDETKYATDKGRAALRDLGLRDDVFDFPKPVELIRTVVEMATSAGESELVVDFFAGSGSTAEAVLRQNEQDGGNRRFVLVQLPEPTTDVDYDPLSAFTRTRIVAATEQYGGGVGLRSYRLEASSFRDAFAESDELFNLDESTLVDEPNVDAVAAEVFLKEGVGLDAAWGRNSAGGADVVVADGVAVVLSLDITDEVSNEALGLEPRVIVFLEDGFAGKDSVKANAFTKARNLGITMKTV